MKKLIWQSTSRRATLLNIFRDGCPLPIQSPVTGKVAFRNHAILSQPCFAGLRAYETGWICAIEHSNLSEDLKMMKIGNDAVSCYQSEVDNDAPLAASSDSAGNTAFPIRFAEAFLR